MTTFILSYLLIVVAVYASIMTYNHKNKVNTKRYFGGERQ